MCTLANSDDPDEMPHNVAFHQGLHYLLRRKRSSKKEIPFLFGDNNLIYTMGNPKFTVYKTRRKNSLVHKELNLFII